MAKDKNGKELPKGITYLPKKGLYMARFMYEGVPYTYYEKTAKQAAKTLADKRYEVEHGVSGGAIKSRSISGLTLGLRSTKSPTSRRAVRGLTSSGVNITFYLFWGIGNCPRFGPYISNSL